MTSVSQLLPNFIQGINEQPDELKKPGQVRNAVNVYPDVVTGLSKRTGYDCLTPDLRNYANESIHGRGTWFVMRRRDDQGVYQVYFFNITPKGYISGWDSNGNRQTIYRSDKAIKFSEELQPALNEDGSFEDPRMGYLEHTQELKLKTAILENTAFIANPHKEVERDNTVKTRPYEAFIEITTFDVTRAYSINFDKVGSPAVRSTIATDFDFIEDDNPLVNFNGYSDTIWEEDQQCGRMTRTYTLSTNEKVNRNGDVIAIRDSPIIVSVSIAARPDAEKEKCNFYVQDQRLINGGSGWKIGDRFTIYIPDLYDRGPGEEMRVKYQVTDITSFKGPIDEANITVQNVDATNARQILTELAAEIEDRVNDPDEPDDDITTQIIGNGIYIKAPYPFRVDTSEKDIINVLSGTSEFNENWEAARASDEARLPDIIYQYPNPYATVNNASSLPLECKNGFLAKVANSFIEDDDYYVQFKRSTKDTAGESEGEESGEGYWEEVAKPGESTAFKNNTLPAALVYDSNRRCWFIGPVKWAKRTVGTREQFEPSIVENKINNVMFYRNRLMFLSGSHVVTSQAGDFTNLYPGTAITTSPSDPIDIEASSDFSPNLFAGIIINNAMLLFSEYSQFLLTTDSDVFAPNTAKINRISSFQFDTRTEPFMLGTNVGFIGHTDKSTILYEMTNVFREGQADVIERSKVVSNKIAKDYTIIDSSRDEGLIILGRFEKRTLWVHKYFKETSQKDIQQAWVKWDLDTTGDSPNTNLTEVVFHFFEQGKHYLVSRGMPNNPDDETHVCSLSVNDLVEGERYTDALAKNGDELTYKMKVELPTFFLTKSENQTYIADTTASLVLHRMHLNTGATNYYDVIMKRYGKDDYVVRYEQSIQDDFKASGGYTDGDDEYLENPIFEPITYNREETIPIYERNTNVNITIESDYDSPFTLYSLRWEGDYTTRYYQRV